MGSIRKKLLTFAIALSGIGCANVHDAGFVDVPAPDSELHAPSGAIDGFAGAAAPPVDDVATGTPSAAGESSNDLAGVAGAGAEDPFADLFEELLDVPPAEGDPFADFFEAFLEGAPAATPADDAAAGDDQTSQNPLEFLLALLELLFPPAD